MSRAYCYRCYRPQSTCLCAQLKPVDNQAPVIILQHKDETRHPRGSAIIADLYLTRCTRLVGEDFSGDATLNTILNENVGRVFLLFPADKAASLSAIQHGLGSDFGAVREMIFLFIDASWRKAKKIRHLSSNLASLPMIQIDNAAKSNYRIRKEPESGFLSTLEAIVTVLSTLEGKGAKYQPLLEVFDRMIDRQIACMGETVYQQNYGD